MASLNTPQAQVSTQEQLEWLRGYFALLKRTNIEPKNSAALIRLANVQGLYDAADHIERKAQQTNDLEKMMEW